MLARIAVIIGFAILQTLPPASVQAGLSAPYCYVLPAADGVHFFVMRSNDPGDTDRNHLLPDRSLVDVPQTFAKNGLYRIGSTEPVWVAPDPSYFDKSQVLLSDNGRYAAFIDYTGARFCDRGETVRWYPAEKLLDYPELTGGIDPRSRFFYWLKDGRWRREGEVIFLQTGSHEEYRFELAGGRMISEYRPWRMAVWGFRLALLAPVILGCWFLRRALRSTPKDKTTRASAAILRPRNWLLVNGLFGAGLVSVSWAIFGAIVLVTWFLTRQAYHSPRRLGWWVGAVASWAALYAFSIGPMHACLERSRLSHDVRMAIILWAYAPVVWALEQNDFLSRFFHGYVYGWNSYY